MAKSTIASDIARLDLEDGEEDTEQLFASPTRDARTAKEPPNPQAASKRAKQPSGGDNSDREEALQAELKQLRQMNSTLENLTASLTTAKQNLSTMQTNMNSTKSLLEIWSRILSQAEHNQRLILDPTWGGATKDMEDMENEELRKRDEAERKIREEEERREELQRKRDEEIRRREEEERRKARGLGRSRSVRGSAVGSGVNRRGSTAGTGLQGTRGRGALGGRGVGSGIGRGGTATRGRGRG